MISYAALTFRTHAERVPGLISLSALNNPVRFVWLVECMF